MGVTDDQAPYSRNSIRMRGSHPAQPALAPVQSERRERVRGLTASDVMTVGEVAALLHVPESTVSDWARRRVIPSLKLGRRRIFVRSKIEAIILAEDE
jgi:excisionase family DNA binding protein